MIDQRTPEWHAARLGKVTASKIADVMAKGRGGEPSATRAAYRAQLVLERLTGQPQDSYRNAAMDWGVEQEPMAINAYETSRDVMVMPIGFVEHPTIAMAGASPDGLVNDDGLVEVKCPNSATHLATLEGAPIDKRYLLQMQWQMACTGRQWCDFVSYDPRFPEAHQLHVQRVARDADLIAEIEVAVSALLSEVDASVTRLAGVDREAA